jgi:hypothetical protein
MGRYLVPDVVQARLWAAYNALVRAFVLVVRKMWQFSVVATVVVSEDGCVRGVHVVKRVKPPEWKSV